MSSHKILDASRGALARERMLHTALDLFGRHGFDATTTRMIALAAGVNLGAIPYYFGSKENLYTDAAAYLADFIEARQQPSLQGLRAQAAQAQDTSALIEQVVGFVLTQLRMLMAPDVPASWVAFYLRAQAEHGEAFEQVFSRAVEPIHDTLAEVVSRIIQRPTHDFNTKALAFWVCHQCVCLRLSDAVLMRRLQWDEITPERVEQLITVIGPGLRALLACAANLRAPA